MRNHSDYELNAIASKLSSELASKENTNYSSDHRSYGYFISPENFEKILYKYIENYDLSKEDLEALLPKVTKKVKFKATSKSAIYHFFETTWWLWAIIIFCLIMSSF